MILSCPACATRYVVDPAALRATGRTVRCARCAHTWFQEPPDETTVLARPPASFAASTEPPRPDDDAGAIGMAPDRYRSQLPALREPPPRFSLVARLWLGLGLAVAAIIVGIVVFRVEIVGAWPAANRLYAGFGWAAPQPWDGLEIRSDPASWPEIDGQKVFVLTGDVTNHGSAVKPIPKLSLVLATKANQPLKIVQFNADQDKLAPGERTSFKVSVVDPPQEVEAATVSWATE
jgi:predicted Zn finger-like uncharacterized protein